MPKIEFIAIFVIFLIGAAALILLVAPWNPPRKRRSDRIKLKGPQKRAVGQVKKLIAEGNPKQAAYLLESLGLIREAIDVLENSGFHREAAGVLLRIHRPKRAAALYAQHNMWENAANCYDLAKMPLECARCAKKAGDFNRAVQKFLLATSFEEAAECYVELGKYKEAAELYADIGKENKVIELYSSIVENVGDLSSLKYSSKEIKTICKYLLKGDSDIRLADILAKNDKLLDIIVLLIKKNEIKQAASLFSRSEKDLGPQLLKMGEFGFEENLNTAKLFNELSNFKYAGMVFEQIGKFAEAGDAFYKHEDYEKAASCFEKAGLKDKTIEMRCLLSQKGKKGSLASNLESDRGNNSYSHLADDTSDSDAPYTDSDISQATNATQVIQLPLQNSENSPFEATTIEKLPNSNNFAKSQDPVNPTGSMEAVAPSFSTSTPTKDFDIELLSKIDSLKDFAQSELMKLQSIMGPKELSVGTKLYDYGDQIDCIYFILEGVISFWSHEGAQELVIAKSTAPCTTGWVFLQNFQPSTFKAIAESSCKSYILYSSQVEELLSSNPTIVANLYRTFAKEIFTYYLTPHFKSNKRKAS